MKQKFTFSKVKMLTRSLVLWGGALILFFISVGDGETSIGPKKIQQIKYRTNFGSCPSQAAGKLALKLIKVFEETGSLLKVKEEIVYQSLPDHYFLSTYKIDYNPLKNQLYFRFDCPKPLMKVQIYKDNGIDTYEAILVSSGKLFDPTYEVLLRSEKKLKGELPFLAIPVGNLQEDTQRKIADVINKMDDRFKDKIAEIILDEKGELTVILSLLGNPSSVFFGQESWTEKTSQLMKIVDYMEAKKKIPAIINLTNSKKVVVKFNSKP